MDDSQAPSKPIRGSARAHGRDQLAFGVEPSNRAYRLRLARYQGLGEAVGEFLAERARAGDLSPVDFLDVGVGSGRSRRYIERQTGADRVRYHGVDLSLRRLDSVYAGESWNLVQADVQEGLPFPDASFDVVVCEQVLEHLEHPERVMAEFARLLRPDGLLIVGVPIFPPGIRWLRAHAIPAIDRLLGKGERGHVQVFSLSTLRDRLRAAGGGLVETEARGFRWLSGGLLAPLEDHRWFWRLSCWLGRVGPSLCVEVQILARKRVPETPA